MLRLSHSSLFRPLLAMLWVTLFVPLASAGMVEVRQTTNTNNNAFVDCGRYSFIANLSTIASNTTYRSAYMLSTTDGSFKAQTMLNTAQLQLPLLINNEALNQQCGNASAAALIGAAQNFTNGMISEYKIQAPFSVAPSGIGGTITVLSMIFIALIFGILGMAV